MTDEPKVTKGLDISRLGQPLLLDIPAIGEGRIDAITIDFLNWFQAGERSSRWRDRNPFLRTLLVERITLAESAEMPSQNQVLQISDSDLDAIDQLFMQRLAPHWSLDDGPWSDSAEEPETDAEPVRNFLNHMRRYVEKDVKAWRALKAGATGAFSHLRIFDQINPVLRYLDVSDQVGKAMRVAEEQQKLLSGTGGLGMLARGESLSLEVDRIVRGIAGGRAEAAAIGLQNIMRSSGDFGREVDRLLGIGSAVKHATALQQSHAANLARQHANVSREVDRMLGISIGGALGNPSELDRLTSTIGGALAKHSDDLWSGQHRLESALYTAKAFGLGLRNSQISELQGAIAGLAPLNELTTASALKQFFDPGFQSAAALGISGAAGQGLVSDVLRSYNKSAAIEAALFSAVVGGVHVIGNPEASAKEVGNALHIVISALEGLRHYARKEYEKAGLIATLSLIASLLAIWLTLNPDNSAESVMLKEVREASHQLGSIRTELSEDVARAAVSQIRYVHAASPLRTQAGRDGPIVRQVYPDQWVKVRETKGDWAHVEVHDYQSDASISGWMHRNHLRRQGR